MARTQLALGPTPCPWRLLGAQCRCPLPPLPSVSEFCVGQPNLGPHLWLPSHTGVWCPLSSVQSQHWRWKEGASRSRPRDLVLPDLGPKGAAPLGPCQGHTPRPSSRWGGSGQGSCTLAGGGCTGGQCRPWPEAWASQLQSVSWTQGRTEGRRAKQAQGTQEHPRPTGHLHPEPFPPQAQSLPMDWPRLGTQLRPWWEAFFTLSLLSPFCAPDTTSCVEAVTGRLSKCGKNPCRHRGPSLSPHLHLLPAGRRPCARGCPGVSVDIRHAQPPASARSSLSPTPRAATGGPRAKAGQGGAPLFSTCPKARKGPLCRLWPGQGGLQSGPRRPQALCPLQG